MKTAAFALLAVAVTAAAHAQSLEIRRGDHIALIGNTLADRMQHDGWLETMLHSRYPEHELVVRNLGFAADELTIRLRSANFGSPDEWLTRTETDVVFAFFGYNESFAGEAGLEKFKGDLTNFIRQTRAQKYNGESAPGLVLFSPIAHEYLTDPNLPDGRENNARLELYTQAMREVAQANDVPFVDLFRPSQEAYERADDPLTINGIHLNERGNRAVAEIIDQSLFPQPVTRDEPSLERLRQAVLDKNFHWFNRYRTTDGYSIYGGRADLKFTDGQTNREVAQREMEVLDVMTANRDKRIWAVARGGDLDVDDSNTPPFIPVVTNKPGAGPNGTHLFLGGEEAIEQMTVAEGMEVTLFASEEQFPELINPVQMAFDTKGRLWVATWPTYPHWKPKAEEMNDRLLIFEDTDGDGRADECKTFAGGLHNPTGFELWGGGVFVAMAPDILFLKDTDGDDVADVRVRVLSGLDSADTHHTSNSFTLDPGGALYFQEGTFHHTQVETPYSAPVRCANAGVFRYEPRTQKFEVYVSHGFANPHGHAFDRWGQDIVVDGTGANPYHAALFSGHVDFPNKHGRPPQVYQQRTRPCPGIETLSSSHFPEENQGNLLVANVIGFQGILQYKIEDQGASFAGTEVEPILSSTDPNFRPVDLEIGPDGALWFVDWQNPIIGHMQHNLRDPNRDKTHGRVYRVTCKGRKLIDPPQIAGEPIPRLLDLLKSPDDRLRYRVRIELSARDSGELLAALESWLTSLDAEDPEHEHHVLEALWLCQSHNRVDEDLLERVLASPDFRARAAAARVLCYWRDRVPNSLERFKALAADEHPRVRLEAIRAASFYTEPEAVEIPLIAAELPSDEFLDFTRGETMKTLEPHWKRALAEKRPIHVTSDAGLRFFLRNTSLDDLLKLDRSRGVCLELIFRPGVRDEFRSQAITDLARLEGTSELAVLLDAIGTQDARGYQDESVAYDHVRLLTARRSDDLAAARADLERLATEGHSPIVRQIGYVGLIAADGSVEPAWNLAVRSVRGLRDLLAAMPMLPDAAARAALYPKVEPLLAGLPPQLASSPEAQGGIGRFVRIELPRRGTLTLAEVEVISDGRNIARRGKARQKNTGYGGDPNRALDGNTNGNYNAGGQTHTEENTRNPWWEVDLEAEYPIERITVYNRTDGPHGKRLDGFTLIVLDAHRDPIFTLANIPAPTPKADFELAGGGPESLVRRAAMIALTSVRGQEPAAFKAIARFAREGSGRHAALQALQRIPASHWPQDEAQPLVESLIAYLRQLPVQDRTSPAALDALQMGHSLAALLPADRAAAVRRELLELGVRIVRVGTVPHQMLFDQERLVVQAGKPVEFLFENTDIMPHNFVLLRPGALEEVGMLAETTATQPGVIERQYVPQSDKVLLASDLLQPKQSQKLSFEAPAAAGVYPFVCTYPGHWRRMYGALYVVEDLDRYLADPEAYLAAHPLSPADPLLKFVRPRKEWTLDDLAASVEELEEGRSFTSGRQLFQAAACASCHKLNGTGREVGPDLAQLDPKFTKLDVLRELLDPSARINEKFQSWTILTTEGKVVTGLIVEETPESVTILENPLAGTAPVVIPTADIDEREKAKTSIMPRGLLDKLTREEILDLVAYIAARGDERHPLFQGAHAHAGGHEGH